MAEETEAPVTVNLGGMLGDKLTESIKKMDLVAVLKNMISTQTGDEESVEIQGKLKSILEKFENMDAEEREKFTMQIKDGLAQKLSMKLKDAGGLKLEGLEEAIKDAIVTRLYFLGFAAIVVFILVVFFGYKLYKSIKEKQVKREEKKKAKQLKKKK